MNYKYIVELEIGVWLAPWYGDPGRTVIKENAKKFTSSFSADGALLRARKYGLFLNARIEVVK